MKKYDDARIKSEDHPVWQIKQTKTQTILF